MSLSRRFVAIVIALAAVTLSLGVWLYMRQKTVPPAPIPDVSTLTIDRNFCENNVATCERLCAGCADKELCFKTGGECPGAPPPAIGTLQDQMDRGPDVWIPGCHFQFRQAGCVNGGPWTGDFCEKDGVTINEWFNVACHDAQGDHYKENCDTLCKKIGLGAGRCVTDKAVCPGAIDSAHCVCEKGQPGPTPQNPT